MAEFFGQAQPAPGMLVFDITELWHNDALCERRRPVGRLFYKAGCVKYDVVDVDETE